MIVVAVNPSPFLASLHLQVFPLPSLLSVPAGKKISAVVGGEEVNFSLRCFGRKISPRRPRLLSLEWSTVFVARLCETDVCFGLFYEAVVVAEDSASAYLPRHIPTPRHLK